MDKYVISERDPENLECAGREIGLVTAPPTGITGEMSANAAQLMEEVIAPKFQALLAGETTAQEMYDVVVEEATELFGEENCELGAIAQ